MSGPLATLWRKKYPGDYDDLSDEELEKLVVKKYPGDYDDLVEPALPKMEVQLGDIPGNVPARKPVVPLTQPEEPGFLKQVWDAVNKPLIESGLSPEMRAFSEEQHPLIGRAMNFGTDVLSGLSSPLNIATAGMFGGAGALAGRLPQIARMLKLGGAGLSAGVATEGGIDLANAETGGEAAVGGLELLGGILGMKQGLPKIGKSIASDKIPDLEAPLIDTKPPKPKSIITDGADVIDKATGEVVDMSIKPSINPLTKNPIDPVKHKPAIKMINESEGVLNNPSVETVQQMNDGGFYTKKVNEDGSLVMTKRAPKPKKADEPYSAWREIWNLSRGMISVDLPFMTSAAFRQAKPNIGTPNWFKAWDASARSFGSQQSFDNVMNKINSNPYFKKKLVEGKIAPSLAEQAGVKIYNLNGLTKRDEVIRSQLAEKIPLWGKYIKASNRAYVGFTNDLASNNFIDLVDTLKAQGKNPELDIPTLKAIGEVVNHGVGRGKLAGQIPFLKKEYSAERGRSALSEIFFSPSLITQNIRMLNPSTYIYANPAVRKQYVYGMLRTMTAWGTLASIAKISGGEVSVNPTNSDFGKIKIGDTRIDIPGGLQQFITLIARETLGETTSSTSGETTKFGGKGFNVPTEFSTAVDFTANKLHPNLKLIVDIARATGYRSVHMGDRIMQMAVPMYTNDIAEIMEEHPEMVPIIMGLNSTGMSTQTYEAGKQPPKITPMFGLDKYDYEYKGGRPWR